GPLGSSLSDEINKCDMKKYTAEEINEMINSSNEFINRNDMNIIFSYVHESEREKFKKVEENIFKFIQSIVETYKIPDEYKMRKFKFAHFEMQGYALKQEKFLLEYAFLSLNGKLCERKKFKEVLEYVKREWIEFRKSMFDVWKEKLASEFREHGEMLNQKRKLKQHEL
uniref:PHIST n=1 Tax=Plasmodium falciparum (isolate 3D7) TaxID=36329 RepID=UPI0004437F64|nr:Chain A, Phist [Plasmodium falciparum 3D7]4JLE_B Chain B, Phist [Plasmodium falciparum 3D7]